MKLTALPLAVFLSLPFAIHASAQDGMIHLDELRQSDNRKLVRIPDVNGFRTLKCDFHMHTVFTDGHVWPNVRVQEAYREGLDAFAFTEHLEYAPHKDDVTEDVSRPHELAKDRAAEHNLTLIKGVEITRETPPGHFNALFVQDTSGYITDRDPKLDLESIQKAVDQKAFIFWNHPGWQADKIKDSYEWLPFIEEMYQKKNLHGIEVANGFGIYAKAIDWAIDRNLTIIGNSDIHNLISLQYDLTRYDGHRTMTLVFAKDSSPEAIREALEAGRTVAWAGKYLIGTEKNVRDLFSASVSIAPSHHSKVNRNNNTHKVYEVTNNSDLVFEFKLTDGKGTKEFILTPSSSALITAPEKETKLTYELSNTLVRSDKHLTIEFDLK